MTYTHNTTIELCGETYDAELTYEFAGEAYPIIYQVEIVKQTCKKNECFYNENGQLQSGPAYLRMSITDLLSVSQIGQLADEIITANLERATDAEIDRAREWAMDRWHFRKTHGLDEYPGYAVV